MKGDEMPSTCNVAAMFCACRIDSSAPCAANCGSVATRVSAPTTASAVSSGRSSQPPCISRLSRCTVAPFGTCPRIWTLSSTARTSTSRPSGSGVPARTARSAARSGFMPHLLHRQRTRHLGQADSLTSAHRREASAPAAGPARMRVLASASRSRSVDRPRASWRRRRR